jgi:hypothetical protein
LVWLRQVPAAGAPASRLRATFGWLIRRLRRADCRSPRCGQAIRAITTSSRIRLRSKRGERGIEAGDSPFGPEGLGIQGRLDTRSSGRPRPSAVATSHAARTLALTVTTGSPTDGAQRGTTPAKISSSRPGVRPREADRHVGRRPPSRTACARSGHGWRRRRRLRDRAPQHVPPARGIGPNAGQSERPRNRPAMNATTMISFETGQRVLA